MALPIRCHRKLFGRDLSACNFLIAELIDCEFVWCNDLLFRADDSQFGLALNSKDSNQ